MNSKNSSDILASHFNTLAQQEKELRAVHAMALREAEDSMKRANTIKAQVDGIQSLLKAQAASPVATSNQQVKAPTPNVVVRKSSAKAQKKAKTRKSYRNEPSLAVHPHRGSGPKGMTMRQAVLTSLKDKSPHSVEEIFSFVQHKMGQGASKGYVQVTLSDLTKRGEVAHTGQRATYKITGPGYKIVAPGAHDDDAMDTSVLNEVVHEATGFQDNAFSDEVRI